MCQIACGNFELGFFLSELINAIKGSCKNWEYVLKCLGTKEEGAGYFKAGKREGWVNIGDKGIKVMFFSLCLSVCP